jgi:hypothetical protein
VCFSTTGLIICYSLFLLTILSTDFGFQNFEILSHSAVQIIALSFIFVT